LRLPLSLTSSQINEVTTFTEYCTARIDRSVQQKARRWRITLAASGTTFVAFAIAVTSGSLVHARGSGREPVYAIWDALCRVEQPLREVA
jgi:hypothetical protein